MSTISGRSSHDHVRQADPQEAVARLAARSGGAAAVRRSERASGLRGFPVAAGLRRTFEVRGRRPRLPRRQIGVLRRTRMGETDKSYWLLSETSGIGETRDPRLQRNLPLFEGLRWLAAGWRDFWTRPGSSIAYGIGVFVLSVAFIWTLVAFGRDYILFPSLAGFMIIAPFLAVGLYEKSRAIEEGREASFGSMLRVRPRAGAQVFFTGLLLCMLMLLWNRAAVLLWA